MRCRSTGPAVRLAASVLTVGLTAGCTSNLAQDVAPAARTSKATVVVAVGDIACRSGARVTRSTCRHARTAKLARSLRPDAVLALGDLQYDAGKLSDFRSSYDTTWGRMLGKTYPVLGNHEYGTAGGRGYYTYFEDR